jgi:hypothetical protein
VAGGSEPAVKVTVLVLVVQALEDEGGVFAVNVELGMPLVSMMDVVRKHVVVVVCESCIAFLTTLSAQQQAIHMDE